MKVHMETFIYGTTCKLGQVVKST